MVFFKFIPTSKTGVVQTFGKFTRLVKPGLRLYIPVIQTITPISNRLTQDSFHFEVKTKDNVFARLGLAVQYKIEPENTELAYFSLDNPKEQIDAYIENVVRAKVPKMKLDELFESQDDICNSVATGLSEKMRSHGFTIENTLVTEINPAADVKEAMNRINASERLKEATRNEAEANYILKVREAEADRDRKRLQGEGISAQRKAILKGYEDGVEDMAQRLGLTSKDIINFVTKVQHLDTLESISKSPNTKTIFLDHNPESSINKIKSGIMEGNEVRN